MASAGQHPSCGPGEHRISLLGGGFDKLSGVPGPAFGKLNSGENGPGLFDLISKPSKVYSVDHAPTLPRIRRLLFRQQRSP